MGTARRDGRNTGVSTDGGLSWSPPSPFEYSKRMREGTEMCSALVYSVVTAPNGNLVATVNPL